MATLSLGDHAPAFDLPGIDGRNHTLDDYREQPVAVVFSCCHCPYVLAWEDRLNEIAGDYAGRAGLVAINSNAGYLGDSWEDMERRAEEKGFRFPFLYDETQEVARAYRAACTPDFYVFDEGRRLAYRGQLDGSRPGNDVPVTGRDLRAALDAVLAGQPVVEPQSPSLGCNIKWKPGGEPDYFG